MSGAATLPRPVPGKLLGLLLGLLLLLSTPVQAQDREDIARLLDYVQGFQRFYVRVMDYDAEVSTADHRLSNALDGYGDLEAAKALAAEVLVPVPSRLEEMRRLLPQLVAPEFKSDGMIRVMAAMAPLPEKLIEVYAADAEVLRGRLTLAEEDPGNLALNAALDQKFSRNAVVQIEAENALLEANLAIADPSHPQYGLTVAILASNRAALPMARLAELGNTLEGDEIAEIIAQVRDYADQIDSGLEAAEVAIRKWAVRGVINRHYRRMAQAYSESLPVEREVATVIRELADMLEAQVDSPTYDPEPYYAIDARFMSLIDERARQAESRAELLRELTR